MKLNLELPDWVEKKNIYIISALDEDIELVAYKELSKNWKIKETRCSRCGACCLKWFNSANPKDPCEHFVRKDGRACCDLGVHMQFSCVIGISKSPYISECVVDYKEIK